MKRIFWIPLFVALVASPSRVLAECAACCFCLFDGNSYYCVEGSQGWTFCAGGPSGCTRYDACGWVGGCFLPGVAVSTGEGVSSIEELDVGEPVLGCSEDGTLVEGVVSKRYGTIQIGFYLINGSVGVTASHQFRTRGGWKAVRDLRVGDELVRLGGGVERIETIEYIDRGVRVYNIEVDDIHTFFANGYLVHNKPPDPGG